MKYFLEVFHWYAWKVLSEGSEEAIFGLSYVPGTVKFVISDPKNLHIQMEKVWDELFLEKKNETFYPKLTDFDFPMKTLRAPPQNGSPTGSAFKERQSRWERLHRLAVLLGAPP